MMAEAASLRKQLTREEASALFREGFSARALHVSETYDTVL